MNGLKNVRFACYVLEISNKERHIDPARKRERYLLLLS